ncbi:rRNA maturation RNase YbeY [Ascidiaceihabitans sp.]|uniref:rRNA maturation RNase YbeY n=1 Tax=Ascidiaceihabitans sp. TaxID=1872644 RepID=UPI00329731D3
MSITLDITVEDTRWDALSLDRLAHKAAHETLGHLGLSMGEISLLACNDSRIAELNSAFREKPTATNVLSWPYAELGAEIAGGAPLAPTPDFDGTLELGDIAISYDTCASEAALAGKPMADHVTHLLVHGMLHLLGYDHIRDLDATLMERTEVEILGKLGLDDPYCLPPAG